jgi:hypothetical protein
MALTTHSPPGLQEVLDFILYKPEANNNLLLSEYLHANLNKSIILDVYNMVTQEIRDVYFNPVLSKENLNLTSRDLIGVELKYEKYDDAHEKVYLID